MRVDRQHLTDEPPLEEMDQYAVPQLARSGRGAVDGDGARLVSGAALGLDPREGDFRDAAPVDTLAGLERERALVQSIADPWAPGWIALVAVALLAAWARSTAGAATPRGTR